MRRYWREWRGFILFVVVMMLFRSAIADWNQVPTGSMIPTILEGDRIVVDKLAYDLRLPFTLMRLARWSEPQRSDVITFESPVDDRLLVKRIIGVPGDVVELRQNQLTVNGEAAAYTAVPRNHIPDALSKFINRVDVRQESVLGASRHVMTFRRRHAQVHDSFAAIEVPVEHYLVLGDNRDNSQDFRAIGLVHRDRILGRAGSIAFSLNYDNYYLPRRERFFKDLM